MEIICFSASVVHVQLWFLAVLKLTKGIYASGWFVQMENNKCTPNTNNYV